MRGRRLLGQGFLHVNTFSGHRQTKTTNTETGFGDSMLFDINVVVVARREEECEMHSEIGHELALLAPKRGDKRAPMTRMPSCTRKVVAPNRP